jgi:hypothetical protein
VGTTSFPVSGWAPVCSLNLDPVSGVHDSSSTVSTKNSENEI